MSDIKYGLFKYEVKDYYSILGVPLDASAKEIRLRYLKIAYQLHPDTCRAETAEEKEQASQILSKLVNPAYENLYKDKLRRECQLILSEVGRRLVTDAYQITISTDTAKKLFQEERNLDKLYREMIEKIAPDLYLEVDKVAKKISLISELNMVYLMRSKQNSLQGVTGSSSSPFSPNVQTSEPIITQAPANPNNNNSNDDDSQVSQGSTKKDDESSGNLGNTIEGRIKRLIRSAQHHQEEGNLEQGILDLREALKLDPNNSTCHALIASLYIKQGNLTYARVHLKKATDLNSEDSTVKQVKQELKDAETKDKPSSKSTSAKSKSSSSKDKDKKAPKSSDKSKDKDGKGKKEAPKIFGIPLW